MAMFASVSFGFYLRVNSVIHVIPTTKASFQNGSFRVDTGMFGAWRNLMKPPGSSRTADPPCPDREVANQDVLRKAATGVPPRPERRRRVRSPVQRRPVMNRFRRPPVDDSWKNSHADRSDQSGFGPLETRWPWMAS